MHKSDERKTQNTDRCITYRNCAQLFLYCVHNEICKLFSSSVLHLLYLLHCAKELFQVWCVCIFFFLSFLLVGYISFVTAWLRFEKYLLHTNCTHWLQLKNSVFLDHRLHLCTYWERVKKITKYYVYIHINGSLL